eukprot:CAMPEP_0175164714 /NCGR_PEP_ID=MMETSP0087-20121206/26592_1 /TAXON_ID=136419 /ORGANISM="Unknown Unknown, Strain D1" /LENGTH=438 /DNA_ID=CAMNT_0016453827 /DNA_START=272 /DNA_END=1588 /DNA_ORIENTATION=-
MEYEAINSAVLVGTLAGMLLLGYAADRWGFRKTNLLASSLVSIGAIGSAFCTWGDNTTIYVLLGSFRFILGIGVGGKYPLASRAGFDGKSGSVLQKSANAGRIFRASFLFGATVPFIFAGIFLSALGDNFGADYKLYTSLQFRTLFAIGAIPSLGALFVAYSLPDDSQNVPQRSDAPIRNALANPDTKYKLLGTSLTWLIYDICFYGVIMSIPSFTAQIFTRENLIGSFWHSALVNVSLLPATMIAMVALPKYGAKNLLFQGFIWTTVTFAVSAFVTSSSHFGGAFRLFMLCLIFTATAPLSIGCFSAPTEMFLSDVRSTFFGFSAFWGKIGAFLGSFVFPILLKRLGLSGIFAVCSILSFFGLITSIFFILPFGQGLRAGAWPCVSCARGRDKDSEDETVISEENQGLLGKDAQDDADADEYSIQYEGEAGEAGEAA